MDITQLLITVGLSLGIALIALLAVVPTWLRFDAERVEDAPTEAAQAALHRSRFQRAKQEAASARATDSTSRRFAHAA